MTTIRDALAATRPHVSLKRAWRAAIQFSRKQHREGISRTALSRSSVERFLQRPLPPNEDIEQLKTALRDVLNHSDPVALTHALDVIESWMALDNEPLDPHCPVTLTVSLAGAPIANSEIDRWLGTSQGEIELSALEAARWVHHLHQRPIAGCELTVRAHETGGRALPGVARADRGRILTTGHENWLPHLDEVGRFSATPRSISETHADAFMGCQTVLDPFCGAGADAIAVASVGPMVLASDISATRLELARANAAHFGVRERICFRHCDSDTAIADALLEHHNVGLFLDPPWGGPDWNRTEMSPATLFRLVPNLQRVVDRFSVVVIKLPRTFPIQALGSFGGRWEFKLGIDSKMEDPVEQVKTTIAVRRPVG